MKINIRKKEFLFSSLTLIVLLGLFFIITTYTPYCISPGLPPHFVRLNEKGYDDKQATLIYVLCGYQQNYRSRYRKYATSLEELDKKLGYKFSEKSSEYNVEVFFKNSNFQNRLPTLDINIDIDVKPDSFTIVVLDVSEWVI